MNTIQSLLEEAHEHMDLWESIVDDPQALEDRGKTRTQACNLLEYFQGRVDAFCDAEHIMNKRTK